MTIASLHHATIVDKPIVNNPLSIPFPDLSRLGNSRIGRKLRRKALDAYFSALRRAEGRPAKSGPPIPNSEKAGRREYRTYFETIKGGVHSGYVRDLRAQPRHNQVRRLRSIGLTIRAIAEAVGYSMRHVRRILNTPRRSLAQRWRDAKARLAKHWQAGNLWRAEHHHGHG